MSKSIKFMNTLGDELGLFDFSNIYQGDQSPVYTIMVMNTGTETLLNLLVEPVLLLNDIGTPVITKNSTFLSTDGTTFTPTTTISSLEPNETINIYVKYQPPSNTPPGEYRWTLRVTENGVNINPYPDWEYQSLIEIPGQNTEIPDQPIRITIPYNHEYMEDDYRDIRFSTINGTIIPYLLEESTATTATFIIRGDIPASPDNLYIILYTGNPDAETESTKNIYDFYDEFSNLNKWTILAGTPTITDSILTLPPQSKIRANLTDGTNNMELVARTKISGPISLECLSSPLYLTSTDGEENNLSFLTMNSQTIAQAGTNQIGLTDISDNEYHVLKIIKGPISNLYMDGTLVASFEYDYDPLNLIEIINCPDTSSDQDISLDYITALSYAEEIPDISPTPEYLINRTNLPLRSIILKNIDSHDDNVVPPKVTIVIDGDIYE